MENAKKNDCKTMYKVIIKTVIPQFIWNNKKQQQETDLFRAAVEKLVRCQLI